MGNFFKGIAKGLYNIVIIPVWLIGLTISAIGGFGVFFWQLIVLIGRFFSGKSMSLELPEDAQAKKMLAPKIDEPKEEKENDDVEVVVAEIADPGSTYKEIQKDIPPRSISGSKVNTEDVDFVINEAPTGIDCSNTMPEVVPSFRNDEPINSSPIESETAPVEEEKEEIIEEYSPKGSDF